MKVGAHCTAKSDPHPRRIVLPIVAATLASMLLISAAAQWYGHSVGLPRYCGDPDAALQRLQQVMHAPRPAGNDSRLPYIVSAKLLFLDPRRDKEREADYIDRLRRHIQQACQ